MADMNTPTCTPTTSCNGETSLQEMTPDYKADYDTSIHSNPDAVAWAKLFADTCHKNSFHIGTSEGVMSPSDVESWMTTWFANAMMAQHDFLQRKIAAKGVTELCADHPNLLEYVSGLEKKLLHAKCDHEDILHCFPDDHPCRHSEKTGVSVIDAIKDVQRDATKTLSIAVNLNLDLQNKADMWWDEFQRIKVLCYGESLAFLEIAGICDRAMRDIRSEISLIDQREKLADENTLLRRKLVHYNILWAELDRCMVGSKLPLAGRTWIYCRTLANAKLRGRCNPSHAPNAKV